MDFKIVFAAALIPLLVGFIWYHPKVFGNAWMKAAGVSPDSGKSMNMGLVFFLTYVLSLLISMTMLGITIHQFTFYSIFEGQPGMNDPNSPAAQEMARLFDQYGDRFRTFKHGALHGFLAGLFMAMPIIGINAMFERKGFKYVMINVGYWCVAFLLMGGVVCQWAKVY
jgi:hypothetical protein